jgi:hypothetical protein
VLGAIRNAATTIGVITGAGTIVGWITSTESPLVVLGTAVGYAGMAYCAGFALLGFLSAALPQRILEELEKPGLVKSTLTARALYFVAGCGFAAAFVAIGTDPLDGVWIVLGAVMLFIVLRVTVDVQRRAAAKRRAEYRDCPDCAERIKAKACVCRYCGYRFALPPAAHEVAGPTR